jgi:hypothetical protein
VIGWKEFVDFPAWGLVRVKAKVDTGARTSAVHVEEYALIERPRRRMLVELHLALFRRRPRKLVIIRTPVLRMVTVTSSSGQRETRPLVATVICLGEVHKRVLLTVTNRSSMLFRVLLGRKALEGDFVVDVKRKYLTRSASSRRKVSVRRAGTAESRNPKL